MDAPSPNPACNGGTAFRAHPLLARLRRARLEGGAVRGALVALMLPLRAAWFLAQHPRLWGLALGPALVNIALLVAAAALLYSQAEKALGAFWSRPEGMLLPAWYAAYAAVLVVGGLLSYAVVLVAGGLLASPFNDALSSRTEAALTGRAARTYDDASLMRGILRSIGSTALITLLYGALLLPVLALNLLPGFGSVAATGVGGLVSAFFVALEYADVTLQRRSIGLRRKLRLLRGHLALTLGFGAGVGTLLWVPLLGFLCIPIAVVGGTALALALEDGAARNGATRPAP